MEGEYAHIYSRIIIGYYMYVSAIVKLDIPLEDIYSGAININQYSAKLQIIPSTRYDIWGTEDPRAYKIEDYTCMTYVGRTVYYFNPVHRKERTLPITAVRVRNGRWKAEWRKFYVHVLPQPLRDHVISDKDAFLYDDGGNVYFFHRPHLDDEHFYILVSRVDRNVLLEKLREASHIPTEVVAKDPVWITRHAPFEEKLGWAAPPIEISKGEALVLVHALENEIMSYRVFAMLLELGKEITVKAVTPYYIMAPKTSYELYGDRPYVVFPCGCVMLDNKLIITYGAADLMTGIAEIELSELLSILDKGRIY